MRDRDGNLIVGHSHPIGIAVCSVARGHRCFLEDVNVPGGNVGKAHLAVRDRRCRLLRHRDAGFAVAAADRALRVVVAEREHRAGQRVASVVPLGEFQLT